MSTPVLSHQPFLVQQPGSVTAQAPSRDRDRDEARVWLSPPASKDWNAQQPAGLWVLCSRQILGSFTVFC